MPRWLIIIKKTRYLLCKRPKFKNREKNRWIGIRKNMWWAHTNAGYNFPLESVQKKPFTTLAMGLGGEFWVMTKVLEPVLIRTAWVCGQKFSHLIVIACYGNTSYLWSFKSWFTKSRLVTFRLRMNALNGKLHSLLKWSDGIYFEIF